MPFGIGYTPGQDVSNWGNAQETKSVSRSSERTSTNSSGSTTWNPWQKKVANPWTQLVQQGMEGVQSAYTWGPEELMKVAQHVVNWGQAPPQEYLIGRQALYDAFQPTATEDFYQNAVRAPYLREWEQVERPALREAYAGNYYHSERMRREAQQARDLAIELGRRKSELEYQSQEAAKQRALQGAPTALNYASFIPSAQSDAINAYLASYNPILQAITDYMIRPLETKSKTRSTGARHSETVSHGVSGWHPQGSTAVTAPSSPWRYVYQNDRRQPGPYSNTFELGR